MPSASLTRRAFLASCFVAPAVFVNGRRVCPLGHRGTGALTDHPTPRPGVNASRVPKASELRDKPGAVAAFDEARQIPHIIDGIRCHCGCAKLPGYYSLLSCYEGKDAMAKACDVCQGQARYAYRLHQAGKSLDEIRSAIDERYR